MCAGTRDGLRIDEFKCLFRTTDSFQTSTEIKGVTRQRAIEVLHDHDFFINRDPNLESYVPEERPKGGLRQLPADAQAAAVGSTQCYAVTDRIPAKFARLLPGKATAVNRYQLTNMEDGLFVCLKAALDVQSDRRIVIRGGSDGDDATVSLVLVHEVGVDCNKMLVNVFRGQFEEHWRRIHEALAEKMGGEVVKHSGGVL
ncbi:hypothetical protein RB597_009952 [Gaeumannomyces tritici]